VEEKSRRILLVDPDENFRSGISSLLKSRNYTVVEGTNFTEASEFLSESNFDCLVMNVNLPEMDGCEAVPIIRNLNSKMKIILTSDRNTRNLEAKVTEQNVFYYFIKTFPYQELFLALESVFEAVEMKKAVAYIGTICLDHTKKKTLGYDEQTVKIRQFCREQGIELVEVIRETDCDAPCLDRPGIKELLGKCSGVDHVIVERPWCIGRRASILGQFLQVLRTYDVRLLCATHLWDAASQYVRRFYSTLDGKFPARGSDRPGLN
jgi:DNA-binding response OmpR family regulator